MRLNKINLYAGFDRRQEIGFHTFISSVIHHSSLPVHVTPIGNALFNGLCNGRAIDESTDFTRIRFLIPWLEGYSGWALFCDGSDMILRADLAELWDLRNPYAAVQVVQHEYHTKHRRKFVGTEMETDNRDYPTKNWSSVMLVNCSHFDWRNVTPDSIRANPDGGYLQSFGFIRPANLGSIPVEWNWLADEYGENKQAKLLHFTAGIPAFPAYEESPMAGDWAAAAVNVTHRCP